MKLRKTLRCCNSPFSTNTNGGVIIISKILNIKVITSEHNNYKFRLKNPLIWLVKRLIYKMSNYLMVLTNRDKQEYYGRIYKKHSYNADPLPLIPLNSHNESQRDKIILAVGNVARWKHKGFDNLLSIFVNIENKIHEYKLVIVGGGDATYLKQICLELILKMVQFLGGVNNIEHYMQKATVFVLTSRWEGLPMVLIEAMSQEGYLVLHMIALLDLQKLSQMEKMVF